MYHERIKRGKFGVEGNDIYLYIFAVCHLLLSFRQPLEPLLGVTQHGYGTVEAVCLYLRFTSRLEADTATSDIFNCPKYSRWSQYSQIGKTS